MKKINFLKHISIILALINIISVNQLQAAPNTQAGAALSNLKNIANTNDNSSNSNSNNGNSGNNTNNSGSNTNKQNTTKSGYTIKVFDPFLDNHLKAPPDGIRVGKFGAKITEVENSLREIGAKNHSYAFGKYSKMILSSYQITLNFDVNKRLGMVEIEPRLPLKTVEPKAREFFIGFFTEGADLSQIGIVINPELLELRFINP